MIVRDISVSLDIGRTRPSRPYWTLRPMLCRNMTWFWLWGFWRRVSHCSLSFPSSESLSVRAGSVCVCVCVWPEGWSFQACRVTKWSTFQSLTHTHTHTHTRDSYRNVCAICPQAGSVCVLNLMWGLLHNSVWGWGPNRGFYTTVWLAVHQIVCVISISFRDEGVSGISCTIISRLLFLEMCHYLILCLSQKHTHSQRDVV